MNAALRWLGAVCIALSGVGIGLAGASELSQRVRTLTDFIATFVTIRAEITVRAADERNRGGARSVRSPHSTCVL